MRHELATLPLLVLAAAALTGTARAQWSDDMESYANGSAIEGQGGWRGWDGQNTTFSVVSQNFAFDGAQSLSANPGADTIQEYAGITSGEWVLTIEQYIPAGLTGKSDINLMNLYQDSGPYEWSSTITFNGNLDLVQCLCGSVPPDSVPLLYDQWVELRWVIDLSGDWVDFFYGGAHVGGYAWSSGPFGDQNYVNLALQAIDLYPFPNSTGSVYYDAFSLLPSVIGTNYCGPANTNSTLASAIIAADGSAVAASNDVLLTASQLPTNKFGYFLNSMTQDFVPFAGGSQGDLCLGGAVGRYRSDAASSGPGGEIQLQLDLTNTPTPTGSTSIVAGETWNFQLWYRDNNPSSTSNFTDGISILFQ